MGGRGDLVEVAGDVDRTFFFVCLLSEIPLPLEEALLDLLPISN